MQRMLALPSNYFEADTLLTLKYNVMDYLIPTSCKASKNRANLTLELIRFLQFSSSMNIHRPYFGLT